MIRCLRIGALIATLLTGCTSDTPVDDAIDAAVGIRASGCGLVDRLGTGAVVDAGDRTLIVTSAHTVAGSMSSARALVPPTSKPKIMRGRVVPGPEAATTSGVLGTAPGLDRRIA